MHLTMHYVLCIINYALCIITYALCIMYHASCFMNYVYKLLTLTIISYFKLFGDRQTFRPTHASCRGVFAPKNGNNVNYSQ